VSRAEAAGEIEVRELSAEGLKKLEEAARKKVERNTRRILGRMKQGVGVPHYTTRELQSLPDASGKGFEELWEEIVVPGLCDACGACSAACGQIEMRNGLPRLKGRCPSGCDRCYTACTRTALPVELLESSSNLRGTRVPYMGRYSRIVAVRATSDELLIRAQDGGAVTALIKFSLNTRLVDATLLTCRGREWEPLATLARSASEVAACAGSVYAASSPLPLLRTRS
jgi:coenzyme F420 hydrogenase subunit beta